MSKKIETLACLGPKASFTHEVALELQANHPLYQRVEIILVPTITAVCQMVAEGTAHQGVIPAENSTEGPVKDMLDAFREYLLYIWIEHINPIRQSAFHRWDTDPMAIESYGSKDNALGQVRHHARKLYPNAEPVAFPSTVAAVLEAANNPKMAAFGPRLAAEAHGLSDILVRTDDVHDNPLNATRFITISAKKSENPITGNDKTSLIAQMPDKPGSLYKVLDTFVGQDINLAKIKSFGRQGGEVAFLMDLEGHQQDHPLIAALSRLTKQGVGIKMLGSYPKDNYLPSEISWELDMEYAIERLKNEVTNGVKHQDKTVVAFTLLDRVGALRDALSPFEKRQINLTEIDSLPTGRLGEYIFYLAFENGTTQGNPAIDELTEYCTRLVRL